MTFPTFLAGSPHFLKNTFLLRLMEEKAGLAVDLEFTYETEDDRLALVQMRPLATFEEWGDVEIPQIPSERIVLRGNRMISNGKLRGVRHLVYVDPKLYMDTREFVQIARAVGKANESFWKKVHIGRPRKMGQYKSFAWSTRIIRRDIGMRLHSGSKCPQCRSCARIVLWISLLP